VLDGGWVVNTMPWALHPGERPGTHCIGGWVGPRTGLDGCEKSYSPQLRFNPQIVQPVACCYTHHAILPHTCTCTQRNVTTHSLLYRCSQRYAFSEQEQKVEALSVRVMKGYSRSQVTAPITITSALLDGGKR
jgi:hypothetical protein